MQTSFGRENADDNFVFQSTPLGSIHATGDSGLSPARAGQSTLDDDKNKSSLNKVCSFLVDIHDRVSINDLRDPSGFSCPAFRRSDPSDFQT